MELDSAFSTVRGMKESLFSGTYAAPFLIIVEIKMSSTDSIIRAIIVDDEPYAREDLLALLSVYPEIKIQGEASSLSEARALLSQFELDLVFLDIELFGGDGFDLVADIPPSAKIIFVTSFNQHAVRAFDVNALDYLLKPVSEERLADAVSRLKLALTNRIERCEEQVESSVVSAMSLFEQNDRILIKSDTGQQFLLISDIVAVSSIGGNYTKVHVKGGTSILVHRTLKRWQQILPETSFMRIHRSIIISLLDAKKLAKHEAGNYQLHLFNHVEPFDVSRRIVPKLKQKMMQ